MRFGKLFATFANVSIGDTIEQKIRYLQFIQRRRKLHKKVHEPICHAVVLDLLKDEYYNLKEAKSTKFTVNAVLPFQIILEYN